MKLKRGNASFVSSRRFELINQFMGHQFHFSNTRGVKQECIFPSITDYERVPLFVKTKPEIPQTPIQNRYKNETILQLDIVSFCFSLATEANI